MMVTPNLSDLPSGAHAFHIYGHPNRGAGIKGSKKAARFMAGSHYNPTKIEHGQGMTYGQGMKSRGHLPDNITGADITATKGIMTDKVKVTPVKGRAIMVHRHGNNEAGKPKGGGARFASGVILK
jgi:Cu-Zn family superoxide dismutase